MAVESPQLWPSDSAEYTIRSAVCKQLQYIRQDIGYIAELGQKSAKLYISLVDGYAGIERLDFEPFNESEGLWQVVTRYREHYGCYPERILADKIYRTRQAKEQEYQDNCDRNAAEGIFGTGKWPWY